MDAQLRSDGHLSVSLGAKKCVSSMYIVYPGTSWSPFISAQYQIFFLVTIPPLCIMSAQTLSSFSLPNDLRFNSARNVTLEDTQNWLNVQPLYTPSVDDTPDRLARQRDWLQKSRNKEATELYKGHMPTSCVADLRANRKDKINEYTRIWGRDQISDGELELRKRLLNTWIDKEISSIVLGYDLATQARKQGPSFEKTMTSIAKDMARGNSDRVKLKSTTLLDRSSRDVHRFLTVDRENNKSRFYEALLAHFVDRMDSSYNPFKVITLDRRSTQKEPSRQFRKPFDQIAKQIGSQSSWGKDSFSSGKSSEAREKAVRYLVEAWTDPKDETHGKRERLKRLFEPGRVTYLPNSNLTAEAGSSSRPITSEADEQDDQFIFDSRPSTVVPNGYETDSSDDLGTEAAQAVQFV